MSAIGVQPTFATCTVTVPPTSSVKSRLPPRRPNDFVMDRVQRVVKVEFPIPSENTSINIRDLFSNYGSICNVCPFIVGKSTKAQYFVEFAEKESAAIAVGVRVVDGLILAVYAVEPSKNLRDEYFSVVPRLSKSNSPSPSSKRKRDASSHVALIDQQVKKTREANIHSNDAFPTVQMPPSPAPSPSTCFSQMLKSSDLRISTQPICSDEKQEGTTAHPPPSPLSIVTPSTLSLPAPICVSLPTPESPAPRLPLSGTALYPSFLDVRIIMSLCGEPISFDLEALEDDPTPIIALLKVTSSERDKWTMVGAHYRRKGNSTAALTVITTMVEVMTDHGISEKDLKPAFLMLSSCETDLSRRAEPDSVSFHEHTQKAATWLRKVYGANPPVFQPFTNALGLDFNKLQPTSDNLRSVQRSPSVLRNDHSSGSQDTGSHSTRPNDSGQVNILRREIKSLRDRNAKSNALLDSTRGVHRRLEDDFALERSLRRKAERKLADVEERAAVARRMENFALDQVKSEVAARRAAEERADRERTRRYAAEEREKRSREHVPGMGMGMLEGLASMFQRAAKGESTLLSGSSLSQSDNSDP